MTLLATSSVSPAFGAGTHSGPVFSPVVLTGGTKPKTDLANTDLANTASTNSGAALAPSPGVVSADAGAFKTAPTPSSSAAPSLTPITTPAKTASAAAASANTETARVAAEKAAEAREPTKSADVGEDGQILALKLQGENLSEIAVDLNISVAAVNGDLETDIPKFSTPAPVADPTPHSTISVFA